MRKLVVSSIMSLDGYVEGPGRNVMALPMDGFFDEHNLERQRAADTLLLGATTYQGLKGYWPAAVAGGGTPAFGNTPVPPLRLVDTRRRDGSDNLPLRYQVVNPAGRTA